MLVSSSEGFAREGLLAAILLRADMIAVVVVDVESRWRFDLESFGKASVLAKSGNSGSLAYQVVGPIADKIDT